MDLEIGGKAMTAEQDRHCTCIICEQPKQEQEGIFLISEFICSTCETEIINTDVKDARYPFFIHQMKQIWYKQNA